MLKWERERDEGWGMKDDKWGLKDEREIMNNVIMWAKGWMMKDEGWGIEDKGRGMRYKGLVHL